MKYNNSKKNIILEKAEAEIIDMSIIELGGPFHSPFAKHVKKYHETDYNSIAEKLRSARIDLEDLHLVIDILQIFISEPLESDWGTTYYGIEKGDVDKLLKELIKLYSDQVRQY